MDQILTYFFLIVSVILFCFALIELINRDPSLISKILSLLFFSMGYLCLYFWLFRSGILFNARRLIYSDVAVTYMFGPILYFYVKSLYRQKERYRTMDFLQYLPAVAVFFFIFFNNPGENLIGIGNNRNPDYRENIIIFILNTIADISFFIYTLISAIEVKRIIKRETLQTDRPMKSLYRMLVISLLTYILFFIGHIKRNDGMISAAVLINGINCVIYLFTTSKYPEYTQKVISELRKKNTVGSAAKISDIDYEKVLKKLDRLFEDEKIFQDPDLSVQSLSLLLELKNHQLTYILNKKMETNFRSFVNGHRIDEAKKLLLENQNYSILEIAIEAGFNSKSAFNNIFKKLIGETPSEFRKRNR